MKFPCPACRQDIQCDELWAGHTIQCPICKAEMTVPRPQAAPPPPAAQGSPSIATAAERNNPLVPKPPAAGGLSMGKPKNTGPAHGAAGAPPPKPIAQTSVKRGARGPKPAVKYAIAAAAILVIAGGGYFGWTAYQANEAKKAEEARKAEEAKREADRAERERKAAEERAARAPKELPVVAPTFTLDADKVKIAESKVNGSIAGGAFVCETSRLGHSAANYVLTFCQGPMLSPEREIALVLHLPGNQPPTNQVIEATPDNRSPMVAQILKVYKTDPKYAPKTEKISSGYLLKLETGAIANGMLSGKIYLALRGDDETVIAGMFQSSIIVVDPNAQPAVAQPTPTTPKQSPRSGAGRYGNQGGGGRQRGRQPGQ